MAKYYVNTDEGLKYIKEIDYAQGTIEFTDKESEAYVGRNGFYADATRDMIRRGFSEEYPEVVNLQCETPY